MFNIFNLSLHMIKYKKAFKLSFSSKYKGDVSVGNSGSLDICRL